MSPHPNFTLAASSLRGRGALGGGSIGGRGALVGGAGSGGGGGLGVRWAGCMGVGRWGAWG